MKYLFWLDLEMSGLIPACDRILEVALVVTDMSFQVIESYEAVVYQEPHVLQEMDEWCTRQHTESGLVAKVACGKPEREVEDDLLSFVKRFSPSDPVVLAGNSIGHDRRFVEQWMPRFFRTLHYRMLDVSGFKILFENVYKRKFYKKSAHRALDDILESIAELRFYMGFINLKT